MSLSLAASQPKIIHCLLFFVAPSSFLSLHGGISSHDYGKWACYRTQVSKTNSEHDTQNFQEQGVAATGMFVIPHLVCIANFLQIMYKWGSQPL